MKKDETVVRVGKIVDMKVGDVAVVEGEDRVIVRVAATDEEIQKARENNTRRHRHRIQRPAGQAPMPSPDQMAQITEERREAVNASGALLDKVKKSTNALEMSSSAPGLFYTQAPHLVERVPKKDEEPRGVDVVNLDDLLSPEANRLGGIVIRSTLHQFVEDNCKYVVPCEYAAKPVLLDENGELPEEYCRRWANFLNDLAARGVWKYGVLVKCGFLETIPLDPTKRQGVIMSFIFADRKFALEAHKANQHGHAYLNSLLKTDVFCLEGNIGSSDWSTTAFPW